MTDEPAYLADGYDDRKDIITPVLGDSPALIFFNVDPDFYGPLIDEFTKRRATLRRQAAREREKAKRRADKIRNAGMRLQLDAVWFTALNERMAISQMTPRHAARSIALLEKNFGRWIGDQDISYDDLGMPYSLAGTPLFKALTKRSKVKETKRHRALDEVSDTVYRAAAAGNKVNLVEIIHGFEDTHSGPGRHR